MALAAPAGLVLGGQLELSEQAAGAAGLLSLQVAAELEQRIPYALDKAAYDYGVLPSQQLAWWFACPRDWLDLQVACLRQAGLNPVVVDTMPLVLGRVLELLRRGRAGLWALLNVDQEAAALDLCLSREDGRWSRPLRLGEGHHLNTDRVADMASRVLQELASGPWASSMPEAVYGCGEPELSRQLVARIEDALGLRPAPSPLEIIPPAPGFARDALEEAVPRLLIALGLALRVLA